MIELHKTQLLLGVASIGCLALLVAIIIGTRSPGAWDRRGRRLAGAGISGFASGACLGGAVAVGRPTAAVTAAVIALGAISSVAATGIVLQALWLFERARKAANSTGIGRGDRGN